MEQRVGKKRAAREKTREPRRDSREKGVEQMQWRKERENKEIRRQQRTKQLIETEGRLEGASKEEELGAEKGLQGSEQMEKKVRREKSEKRME